MTNRRLRHFFAGAAGLSVEGSAAAGGGWSRRSILADLRSFSTISACALCATKFSSWLLDLVEGRRRLGALVLDLDDVPAELRLDRIGNLALVELERDFGEFRHHLVLGEVAEIAAVGGAGVLGFLLGERGEVRALLQLGFDVLGLRPRSAPGYGAHGPLPRAASA